MWLHGLILAAAVVSAVQGWSMHLLPSGERLTNRLVGENFLVVCSIVDFDGPASEAQVNWIKDNEVIRAGGRIMTIEKPLSSQLMIVHARKEDSGDYMCQAKLGGETKHSVAKITFIKAPEFVEPKKEQHPEEGTDAEIVCKVDGEPGVEIFWQLNGQTLGETSLREYDFKDNKQVLVIPHYQSANDDGLYLCNAAQFSSFETLSINVTGYSRPVITVFDTPANNLGYEGQAAQFKCQAVGKPKPTYKWYKVADDEEIAASDLYTVEDGLLVVNALSESNEGQYKCVATNDVGSAEKIADLDVFLKPIVEKIGSEEKQGGEDVTFTCRFEGEGKVSAKFVFGGEEFKGVERESSEEREEEAVEEAIREELEEEREEDEEEEDEGTTVDENEIEKGEEQEEEEEGNDENKEEDNEEEEGGEDDDGSNEEEKEEGEEEEDDVARELDTDREIEEDTIVPPEDDDDEDSDEEVVETTTAENGTETEETTVEGEEETEEEEKKRWRRFVRDVNSQRIIVSEEEGALTLTIKSLSQEDSGEYQCIVENEAGQTIRAANLSITHAPEMTDWTKETVRTFEGEPVTLHCAASAVPAPSWKWYHDGTHIEANGADIIIDSATHSSKLTKSGKANYGEFKCEASNGIGEAVTATMSVVKVVKPNTPSTPSCQEHVYPNYGHCSLDDEEFETDDGEGSPTEVIFFFAPLDAVDDDFDWMAQARNVTVAYDKTAMRIPGLDTNSAYLVRAKAVNEAGESELSPQGTIETTDPWAPEQPSSVSVACESSCVVSWVEPNDHGAPITSYHVTVKELEVDEAGEKSYTGTEEEHTVPADEESFALPGLKPDTFYEVTVVAANMIGRSEPTETTVETPETLASSLSLEQISSPYILGAIIVALLVLFCIIDVLCFALNRCGVLACFCTHCLRRPAEHKKPTDIESGSRGESGRLLDGPR